MNNTIVRYALVLTLISVVSGAALGYFEGITADRIAENRRAREAAAVQAVLETKEFTTTEVEGRKLFFANTSQGKRVAFTSSPSGFGGSISVMVSLNLGDESIHKVVVTEHAETPGLGAKISETGFTDQFRAKPLADPFKVKGDVAAVTGATISSRAVTEGIKIEASRVVDLVKAGVVGE